MPCIAKANCAPERCIAGAAYPDGRVRRLNRHGGCPHVLERDVFAVIRCQFVGPQCLDGGQVVVGYRTASRVIHPENLEFLSCPSHANAKDEPAPTDLVDVRSHASHEQRISIRHYDYRGPEFDLLGDTGQPGQRGERIVKWRGIPNLHVIGDGDVIGYHHEMIAKRLHKLCPS